VLTIIGTVIIVLAVIVFLWKKISPKKKSESNLENNLKLKASSLFGICKSKVLQCDNKYDVNDLEAEISSGPKKHECSLSGFNEVQFSNFVEAKGEN
jgi:hypothetical protein